MNNTAHSEVSMATSPSSTEEEALSGVWSCNEWDPLAGSYSAGGCRRDDVRRVGLILLVRA